MDVIMVNSLVNFYFIMKGLNEVSPDKFETLIIAESLDKLLFN
jgi:hypothetical protein